MVSNDVATLLQWLQHLILQIHQYKVGILCKPGPDQHIADWLSHQNHNERKDQEIAGMNINTYTCNTGTDISVCTSVEDIRNAMITDAELQILQTYIIIGWPQNRDDFETTLYGYQPIMYKLAIIDGIAMKGK